MSMLDLAKILHQVNVIYLMGREENQAIDESFREAHMLLATSKDDSHESRGIAVVMMGIEIGEYLSTIAPRDGLINREHGETFLGMEIASIYYVYLSRDQSLSLQ